MEGKEAPADGVVTGYGKVDGRLVAVAAYDFTVMAGSMGMTGEMKVARLRELALTKRIPMLWLLDSAGARIQEAAGLAVRRLRPPVPRGGHDERRGAAGGGADGPVRGGHRVHPRPRRLRADGEGPRLDGAGRAAPHQGGHRRGRDAGGAGRLAHPHARSRASATSRWSRTRTASPRSRSYLSYFPQNCEEPPPRREPSDPVDRMDEELLDILPDSPRKPYDMYDVIAPHRRRRRLVRPEAALGAHDHHLPRADGRPAGRDRGQPAEAPRRHPRERLRRQGRAVREPVRRLRHPAAVPDGRAGLHGRHEGRAGRDHPARREDALRGVARDGAEDHGRDPQGVRRRLLRDERPRLRARPDRGVAERRDLGDGSRGRREHHLPQADRGGRRPGRHARAR